MILSTREQAVNFAMYALQTDTRLDCGQSHREILDDLVGSIRTVFGDYTFEHGDLESIAQSAIDLIKNDSPFFFAF
jgi:hypothetical protein